MSPDLSRFLSLLTRRGVVASADVQSALELSQASVSRLVAAAGDKVAKIHKGPATRYALKRELPGLGNRAPLYCVSPWGEIDSFADLTLLASGGMLLTLSDGSQQVFHGLPWFIQDMRPQGYMGRFFRAMNPDIDVPANPAHWTDDHILTALTYRGEDCTGHFILGERAYVRYMDLLRNPRGVTRVFYEDAARRADAGEPPGSSVGGEQPKFAGHDPQGRPVLVKFSPNLADGDLRARRWADLLVCEHHALTTLNENGLSAAHSEIMEDGGRVFLEVRRFDRTDQGGRLPLYSGTVVDAEFVGLGQDWVAVVSRLHQRGQLPEPDLDDVRVAWLFGCFIGNSDMHLGNLSFTSDDLKTFRLAPLYDMLPMMLAPLARDDRLPGGNLSVPVKLPETGRFWERAAGMAGDFWGRVSRDERVSDSMRDMAKGFLEDVEAERRQYGKVRARPV